MISTSLIKLTQTLINQPSIHPSHHQCQHIIAKYLKTLNFNIELMYFYDTLNIWAYHNKYKNNNHCTLLFLGHTDVVSPGNLKNWKYPPFSGYVDNDKDILYGRGAVDMKGPIAAMLIAAKNFIKTYPMHPGKLAFIFTSDEEGSGIGGTTKVVDTLIQRNEYIDYCLIGEPSSQNQLGDIIKNGRRGSLTGQLTIYGLQGHVAYPQFSKNPIHASIPILSNLLNVQWDQKKSIFFPPTSIQITHIYTTNTNTNIIPDQIKIHFNLRFNDQTSIKRIQKNIDQILKNHQLTYHIDWIISAKPYFSKPRKFANIVTDIIKEQQHIIPKLETTGGTSDGRFIKKITKEIIELGPCNHTIHKANESINLIDLQTLNAIYQKIMEKTLF